MGKIKGKKILLLTSPRAPIGQSPLHYGEFRPPIGLGFLAQALRKAGHEARIEDLNVEQNDISRLLGSYKPDLVGIYVHSASYKMALSLIKEIRGLARVPIAVGGPHASLLPESFPDTVDFVVIGEGEKAIVDIVEGRIKERVIVGHHFSTEELEHLQWPDYEDFVHKPYDWSLDLFDVKKNHVFSMNTSRGCPFHCKFCGVWRVSGRRHRHFRADRIVAEIDKLKMKYDMDGIYFREDNFAASLGRLDTFCRLLIERDLDVVWACEARANSVDKRALELMKRSGLGGIYVGVESGSQRVLNAMRKGISVSQVKTFFSNCRDLDIKTYSTFCFGTPGETEEDRKITEDVIAEIRPTHIDRFVYVGIPRSDMYDYILENKLYYYKDESGFVYPNGYRELARRYYGEDDKRFIP